MAIYTRSSAQNYNNWWFWIRRHKCIVNLIDEENHIDKIYLYARDLSEPKYEYLIKKREDTE